MNAIRRINRSGFTRVEIMIASLVGMLVIALSLSSFLALLRASVSSVNAASVHSPLRLGMDRVTTNVSQRCNIGATGIRPDAIRGGGSAQVFGDAAVMPGAGVEVDPDAFWSGTLRRDLKVDFPDVVPPRTDVTMAPITEDTTINVAGETYAGAAEISFSGLRTLRIRGNGALTLYAEALGTIDLPVDPQRPQQYVLKSWMES